MEINQEQITTIMSALDTLSLALTDHDHQWTNKERKVYEDAVSLLTSSYDCKETG